MTHDEKDLSLAEEGIVTSNPPPAQHRSGVVDTNARLSEKDEQTARNSSDNDQGQESDSDPSAGLEKWNEPKLNAYRYLATNFGLLIMGMNDACLGVSLHPS